MIYHHKLIEPWGVNLGEYKTVGKYPYINTSYLESFGYLHMQDVDNRGNSNIYIPRIWNE